MAHKASIVRKIAGITGFAIGLLAAWRIWHWQWGDTPFATLANENGIGALWHVAVVALLALGALSVTAMLCYAIVLGLFRTVGFVGRNLAIGFRRGMQGGQ